MRRAARVFLFLSALVAVAAAILAPSGAARTSAPAATTKVTVAASEFKFKLSKAKVHRGTVVFTVKNAGKLAHDFKVAGKKTPLLQPGKSAKLKVVFKKKGRYPYLCTVPGHAAAGMKGVLRVT